MLRARCDDLGRDVLVPESDVLGVRNTDRGILVAYRCWCGKPGVMLTGAEAGAVRSGHAPSEALVTVAGSGR